MLLANDIVLLEEADVFQDENAVLQKVNLSIVKGEFAYLIGKTGSGKSSLLKLIYGALPMRGGKGTVVGYDLGSLNRKNIPLMRRKLGIVFQDFNLLTDRNVSENLLFVLKATGWTDRQKMEERCQEVIKMVGLGDVMSKMPHTLSGGEQQRTVIARALLNRPELIVADEPTGNLDPETSDEILILLRRLSQQYETAVLLATHDYRILEHFPARIIRCQNGKIIDEQHFTI